jgi:hypothetical protein
MNTCVYFFVIIAGAFTGYLVAAYSTDRLGRKPTLILFAACSFLNGHPLHDSARSATAGRSCSASPWGSFRQGRSVRWGPFTELFSDALQGIGTRVFL